MVKKIQAAELYCVKYHLKARPGDEKALRVLAAAQYEQGVAIVDLIDLFPAEGVDAKGVTSDFYLSRVVTTDSNRFRFSNIATYTAACKFLKERADKERAGRYFGRLRGY